MRRIRSKGTVPELFVRHLVHGLGYRYMLHTPNLPGRPDLVFPGRKKIIEVRGCFWHQHRGCDEAHVPKSRTEYWAPKLDRNKKRDKDNLRTLRKLGWDVLVIWECDVREEGRLSARILGFLGD
jgi:DNA mismatch endonuclease (patch repair protein)